MINLQGFRKSKTVTKRKTLVCRNLFKTQNSTDKNMKPLSPWKTDHELLPDNFLLAKTQLVPLVNRLKKDPVVLKTYDNIKKKKSKVLLRSQLPF